MNIEIISIGDELLIGQTINTNASWMGEKLFEIGTTVNWVTTVGDDHDLLIKTLEIAEQRADVILLTGGLGPTHDDVTKKAVCSFLKSELVVDQVVLEHVKKMFRERGIKMVKVNEEQAMVPDKAKVINNPVGTAPAMFFEKDGKKFFVMPGVPFEMKGIMQESVLPAVKELLNGKVAKKKFIATIGIGESTLFEKIGNIEEVEKYARVAFLPGFSGVKIRLIADGKNSTEADEKLKQADTLIQRNIKEFIYAEKDIPLEEAIVHLLTEKNNTLAVAESCTGGLLASKITNVSGSSQVFLEGVVVYSNQAKVNRLGVPENLINEHGAVSPQVAEKLAEQVRKLSGADFGLATTGIAGPTGGTPEKPVGLVYLGYADKNGAFAKKYMSKLNRLENKERFSYAALDLLRVNLKKV